MAKYKCEPNYEVIQPGLHVQFDLDGNYETNDEKAVAALDAVIAKSPFIKRIDKAEKPKKQPEETPKEKTEPAKKPANKKKK